MDSQGKAKVALTFALYQGDQLVRRDTIAQDIVKVGKDPRSHLRVDDELASRMHAVIEVASPDGHHADRSRQRAGHAGERPARQQVQDPPGRSDPDRLDADRARERRAARPRAAAPPPPPGAASRPPSAASRRAPPPRRSGGQSVRGRTRRGATRSRRRPPRRQSVRWREPVRGCGGRPRPIRSPPQAVRAGRAEPSAASRDIDPNAPPGGYTYSMVKSGPDVNPDEVEVAHLASIEVMILWDTNVLHVVAPHAAALVLRRRGAGRQGRRATTSSRARRSARRARPSSSSRGVGASLVILPRSRGYVDIPGQGKVSLAGPHRVGPRASVDASCRGAHEFELPAGAKARMELDGSALVFQVSAVNAGKPRAGRAASRRSSRRRSSTRASRSSCTWASSRRSRSSCRSMSGDDSEAIDRDQILMMQQLPQRRRRARAGGARDRAGRRRPTPTTRKAAPGRAPRAKRGRWATRTPRTPGTSYGVQGPQDNPDPHIARQAALREAAEFGMIGLLNTGGGGDPNAPTAPWGREDSLGNDPMSARGNMWGDTIGDSFGAGGLGLSGVGEGGGGRGEGIGLGNIGDARSRRRHRHRAGLRQRSRPSRRRAPDASRRASAGRDAGERSPPARGHPAHRAPELRSLPPLLRERPAQQPEPAGARRGEVRHRSRRRACRRRRTADRTCRIRASCQCVVRGFGNLSFPQPEGGIVTVVYPIMFNPGD